MRKLTQEQIDARQDKINENQDLVNWYQTITLAVYGVFLAGIFILALLGYFAGVQ